MDSASSDLMAVGTRSDPDNPPDVVRYNLRRPGEITQLTSVNAGLLSGMQLAKTEEINFTSSGNAKVQGWVVKPPDFDPAKKYPLILEIHGGPFSMYSVAFSYMFQNFAANDFVVLYLNPRGSTGYGTAFSGGIDHNYPGPDYDDLMAGVDATVAKGFVDTAHMYVSGCSGGGVLSSWVIGHTDRFAAAAVRCPVIDWLSMTGDTDIPLFTYSFFQKPFWEDPSDWLSHSSVMAVGKVTTPDAADDRRARPAHAHAADRRILRGIEGARRAGQAPAIRGRIPRYWLEAVELHPHSALHDELVQEVFARCRRQVSAGIDRIRQP